MRLWLQGARIALNRNKKFENRSDSVLSKSLSELTMAGTAVALGI